MLPLLYTPNPFCSPSASFFGMIGVASALIFSSIGSAYGTAKTGIGLMHLGVVNSKAAIRGLLPSIMAGVFGIYGFVISMVNVVMISYGPDYAYSNYRGFGHLASGLSVGLCGLAAGMTIGVVGDSGLRAYAKQSKVFVPLLLIVIFAEALGLYGLIVALMVGMLNSGPTCGGVCKQFENEMCIPEY